MASDEKYILDICDLLLGSKALRQHRFDFLLGLPSNRTGRQAKLPVDAFYPDRKLVIEYREVQHTGSVPLFDNRITACGLSRGEQRKLYDELRRSKLPEHGLELIELDYSIFDHNSRRRLNATPRNVEIIRDRLSKFLR